MGFKPTHDILQSARQSLAWQHLARPLEELVVHVYDGIKINAFLAGSNSSKVDGTKAGAAEQMASAVGAEGLRPLGSIPWIRPSLVFQVYVQRWQ